MGLLLTVVLVGALGLGLPRLLSMGSPGSDQPDPAAAPLRFDDVSSSFGKRWGRMHAGIDLAAAAGTPIHAASAGRVRHSGWEAGYGKSVVIDHDNGTQTRYGHCSQLLVKVGQRVAKGALIAKVGSTGHSTGPHLHFEVLVDGVRKNPAWYYRFDRDASPDPSPTALEWKRLAEGADKLYQRGRNFFSSTSQAVLSARL